MPKILITESTLINYGDDRGGVHHGVGDLPDVPKAIAADLVRSSRALYAVREDDTDKSGRNTATKEMLTAAAAIAKAAG